MVIIYFLSKLKNMMSAKDRPGCPGEGMVLRSGIAWRCEISIFPVKKI